MSEAGFDFFNQVFIIGVEFLYAACLALLYRPFQARAQKAVLVFAVYLLGGLICGLLHTQQGTFGLLLTALLAAASGPLGIDRAESFLLVIFYWNSKIASGLIAESLWFILEQSLRFPTDSVEAIYLRATVLTVGFMLTHAAILTAMIFPLQRRLLRQKISLHGRELCYLSFIPAVGILFGHMISRILIEFEDGTLLQLYQRHPEFLVVIPVLALLFYAGAYLTVAFQQGMAALQEEQATHYMEYQQTQAIRARIQEAEQFYTHIRQLKHEMRGHLTNIKGLARSGEYTSLEDYISRMDADMHDFELTLQTGHPVTDVIVNDARRRSLDLGIRFQVDFHFQPPWGYDAFDVGIILQNLLQNAMEACEKVDEGKRFIVLTGKRKGRFFLIEVKNSFTGEVAFGQDGLPATTKKKDAPMHGLGLSNVRREAEKYMGELELNMCQQEFSATVLLQERSNLS